MGRQLRHRERERKRVQERERKRERGKAIKTRSGRESERGEDMEREGYKV